MASSRGISALLALCVLFSTDVTRPESRELRPSDHGLQYQDPPPAGAKPTPEMLSFFGASPSSPSNSSVPSPAAALPNATGSSDDPWWRGGGYGGGGIGKGGRGRRDHVRGALLVACIVCGITGVALLLASGLGFLFKFRKERSAAAAAAAPPPPPPPLRPPLPLPPPPTSGGSGDHKK